jgi:sugar phosphate permease
VNLPPNLRGWRGRIFFGWWVVAGGVGVQMLQAGLLLQAYGIYVPVWQAEFGWSKTTLASIFALQRLEISLMSPLQGLLLQRFGPRRVMRVGLLGFGLGLMLFSRSETLTGFTLLFLLLAGSASLGGFLTLTTVVVNWFERRRATALALMQVGASIGGLLIPLVAWSLVTFGWRTTALVSGVLVLAIGLPLSGLMRTRPEDLGLRPDGAPAAAVAAAPTADAPAAAPSAEPSGDFGTREALRTPAFWLLSLGHGLAVTVVSAITVHLAIHLVEALSFSLARASVVIAFMTSATLVGQLLGGFLGDRFDKRMIAAVAMVVHALAVLVLAGARSPGPVFAFAALHGLAWGVRGPLMGAMRADYFGRRAFATIMGLSTSLIMIGSMGGPILAGVLADRYGSYRPAFMLLAAIAFVGAFAFLFARRPSARAPAKAS